MNSDGSQAPLKSSSHLEGKTHAVSGTETLDLSDIAITQIAIKASAFTTILMIQQIVHLGPESESAYTVLLGKQTQITVRTDEDHVIDIIEGPIAIDAVSIIQTVVKIL